MSEFKAPSIDVKLSSSSRDEEGRMYSADFLITDANHKLFSLHVTTEKNYLEAVNLFKRINNLDENEIEPTLLIPEIQINERFVAELLNKPEEVIDYLVPQDE